MTKMRFLLGLGTMTVLSGLAYAQQATVPTTLATPPATLLTPGASVATDLRTYLGVPGITGQVVQFDTVLGKWNVELLAAAPINSANFLRYVNAGSYVNTFIHRVVPAFVVQGGGYTATVPFVSISRPTTAPLEYNLPNTRGTVAMARTSDINSASSEWFVNTVDNSTTLNPSNGGGYTVFGRVLGTGMIVVDAIAAQPLYNVGFDATGAASTPLRDVQGGQTVLLVANYITVNSVRTIPMYPLVAGETALLGFTATSANVAVVTVAITGSTLTLSGVAAGVAAVTVRGTDVQGNTAQAVFVVTVASGAPVITAQPLGATVPAGQTVALNIAATGDGLVYEWRKNGIAAAIAGATGPTLILPNVTTADAGGYVCYVSNSSAITFSESATLSVGAAGQSAKLSNLSVRANLSAGQILIVGFSTTAKKDLLVRGVGPKLANFGLANFYADPRLEISASGGNTATSNDDWDVALEPTFARVGAFPLDRGSKDAAIVTPVTGGATAQLKGTGSGFVLVEVYDAGGGLTPRLTNVSARNRVGTGGDVLIAGFTIEGPVAKTLLIRGVGPKLAIFGVAGALVDPKLEIYKTNGTKLAENDNWDATVGGFFAGLGAFALDAGSKDAALLITLPPGGYTAQLSGVGATSGEGLIEVYELP